MNWNKLSLKQKADIIKLSVQNGITNLSVIQQLYDSSQQDKQDTDLSYTAGSIVDNLHRAAIEERSLGIPSHNYDFTQSEEWANAHGYYPDSRGHRDDRVKKLSHPTHPSRGTWNSDKEFQLTNLGFEDPNYTIFGMADGNQDPSAILSYKGNIVLPELTVTPKGNYYNNSYDNVQIKLSKGGQVQRKNKFKDGGGIEIRRSVNGITSLNSVRKKYNSFARGGYTKWKEKIREYKGINIDNDPTYNYEEFYNSNPDRAWDMINRGSNTHFVDDYKTVLHPSFSNQSIYSGHKNKFNPRGITGGTWIDNNNYQLSQSQFNNNWDTDATLDYFNQAENSPINLYAPDGSTILRSITVTPQLSALNRSRGATSPNTDFSHAQDMTGAQRLGTNLLAGVPFIGVDPHTCLNTVTGFYDPENTVASNVNIATNPERYGYREIPQSEAIPGDLIILSNSNGHPNHAVMFDEVSNGYGKSNNGYPIAPGDTLVNYSNGGRNSDSYRLQEPLKRFNDQKNAGGDFLGPRIYLRYTGKREKK